MRPLSRRSAIVGSLLVVASSGIHTAGPEPRALLLVRGIAYTIDTAVLTRSTFDPSRPDPASPAYLVFATFAAKVTYAAGRGRLDIIGRRAGPAVVADSAALTTPIGQPGDYYLFDSTGFVLVRPNARSFSSASIAHDAYGAYDYREGWPQFFQFDPLHVDTVSANIPPAVLEPRPLNIYWHTDTSRGIARGRIAIDAIPIGEMTIVRWFGATRALARMADSGRALPPNVTVTAAIPFRPPNEKGVPETFILKHPFSDLRVQDVDVSRLVLPAGFVEVPWTAAGRPERRQMTGDQAAHWRGPPHGR